MKLPVSTSTSPASVANAVTFAKLDTKCAPRATSSTTNRGAIVSRAIAPSSNFVDSSRRLAMRPDNTLGSRHAALGGVHRRARRVQVGGGSTEDVAAAAATAEA